MTREEVKNWLENKTESIEQTDIEKQSMIGEDIIDLMTELIKNHGVSHHVISTLQPCPAVCHGNVINGTCNVCGAKWKLLITY